MRMCQYLTALCAGLIVAGCANASVPFAAPKQSPVVRAAPITRELLFVSDSVDSTIEIYPAYSRNNPNPIDAITNGLAGPCGLYVTADGELFVANAQNNTVAEYKIGQHKPSMTYAEDLSVPTSVAVDSAGHIYVQNSAAGPANIVEYARGNKRPIRTISFGNGGLSGLALDANDNLYTAYHFSPPAIYKFLRGKQSPVKQPYEFSSTAGPTTLAFKSDSALYVLDPADGLQGEVWAFQVGHPTGQFLITAGIHTPDSIVFSPDHHLFVGDSGNASVGVYPHGGQFPNAEFNRGLRGVDGVAVWPPVVLQK